MVILPWIADTTSRKAGAWSGTRPKLTVPAAAVAPMARLFPLTLSAWALGGFYLSLMPSLMIEATGVRSSLFGGAMVSTLMLSGDILWTTRPWITIVPKVAASPASQGNKYRDLARHHLAH
jgi:hypothetical protein